jgi:hypothetical protein
VKEANEGDPIDWMDIYGWPDNFINITKDYYSGSLMMDYEKDGEYYYKSIYEINETLSVNFTVYEYDEDTYTSPDEKCYHLSIPYYRLLRQCLGI